MAATDAGRLLTTLLYSGGFMDSQRTYSNDFYFFELYKNFSYVKLVIKSYSLLLEARGGQARSEEHNQTSALPLFLVLAFFTPDKKMKILP